MKTRVVVRESPIEGLGVFAIEEIKYGQVIGVMNGYVSGEYDEHSNYVCEFEDWNGNFYYVDPAAPFKYLNHADEANADWDTPVIRALRDISPGEEITVDYGEDWWAQEDDDAGTEDRVSVGGAAPGASCMENEDGGIERFAGCLNDARETPDDG